MVSTDRSFLYNSSCSIQGRIKVRQLCSRCPFSCTVWAGGNATVDIVVIVQSQRYLFEVILALRGATRGRCTAGTGIEQCHQHGNDNTTISSSESGFRFLRALGPEYSAEIHTDFPTSNSLLFRRHHSANHHRQITQGSRSRRDLRHP